MFSLEVLNCRVKLTTTKQKQALSTDRLMFCSVADVFTQGNCTADLDSNVKQKQGLSTHWLMSHSLADVLLVSSESAELGSAAKQTQGLSTRRLKVSFFGCCLHLKPPANCKVSLNYKAAARAEHFKADIFTP